MKTTAKRKRVVSSPKILIPVAETVSRKRITQALHALATFRKPTIVLLHVIEVPSRTATLDVEAHRNEIERAEQRLNEISHWLWDQRLKARVKVVVARNVVEGIIHETESEDYMTVFLMKRRPKKGWRRFFARSVSEQVVRLANSLVMTAPLE